MLAIVASAGLLTAMTSSPAAASQVIAKPATAVVTPAASCYASAGHLYCGNQSGAAIYKYATYEMPNGNPTNVVDRLASSFSYFRCWVSGQYHNGGNNIWYYTYGDYYGAWGYVPAVNVWTPTDPFPGVNHC
jgi:hypothetical protein